MHPDPWGTEEWSQIIIIKSICRLWSPTLFTMGLSKPPVYLMSLLWFLGQRSPALTEQVAAGIRAKESLQLGCPSLAVSALTYPFSSPS